MTQNTKVIIVNMNPWPKRPLYQVLIDGKAVGGTYGNYSDIPADWRMQADLGVGRPVPHHGSGPDNQ